MRTWLALLLVLMMVLPLLIACKPDTPSVPDLPDAPEPPNTEDPDDSDLHDTPATSTTGIVRGEGAVLGETKFYEKDVIVANIVATDAPYFADPTGQQDSTDAIQQALYDVDEKGGGVVFLPAGDYLVTRTIAIPSGCVLQGDWQDPDEVEAGKAEYGTVILAKPTPLSSAQLKNRSSNPLIMMDSYSGIVGMTFYYPDQSITKVIPYGYTIYSEAPRSAVLRDITMINSFRGVGAGTRLTLAHELFQNESLHICALDTGVEMYRSTEVGFTVDLTVSPKYWIEAGRGWACKDADTLRKYCQENTIGLIMQKLDDECLSTLRFEYCRTAIYAPEAKADQQGIWGTIYDVTVSDSMYGIVIEELSPSVGLVIANAEIEASEKAVVNSSAKGTLKMSGIKLTGKGGVCAEGGDIMYDDTTDLSQYKIAYGEYKKPVANLYIPDIKALSGQKVDAAPTIQTMLDEAGKTGGVVYLTAGVYSLYSPLYVPENVQLRGPIPVFTRDAKGQQPDGCLLLTYITDGATIYLEENAGVNGLRIFCPVYDALSALEAFQNEDYETETCIAIRGLGAGVYTYNVGITATMIGIDFSDCDDHLIKQTFGCTYNIFALVGGRGGVVTSCLSNPHFVNRQSFAELGYLDEELCDIERQKAYSHGQNEGTTAESGFATLRDKLLRRYCTMVEVVGAEDQMISNIFMYAPYRLVSVSDSTALICNTSADFVGFGATYRVGEESNVIAVNSLRTAGDSVICDSSSSFSLYNRLNTEIYYEGDYHSSVSLMDDYGFEISNKIPLGNDSTSAGTQYVTVNTNKDYIKDGRFSFKHAAKKSSTIENIFEYSFESIDISNYMNGDGYLHMWVYIEDVSNQTWGGSIELTSSGKADDAEIYWIPTTFLAHDGWNELWLPLSDVKTQGATAFNAQKVNYLRIFNTNNHFRSQGDFYIDDMYFCIAKSDRIRHPIAQSTVTTKTEPRPSEMAVFPVEPTDTGILILDNCDELGAVKYGVPLTPNYSLEFIKEGTGSYLSQGHARSNGNEIFLMRGQWDFSPYMENGYLHLWIYFTDEETFKTVNLEVTSSGTFDVQELTFFTAHFTDLKQGWNEIILPFAEASKVMEDFDPSSVNFIRMFAFTEDNTYGDYYIDDIYVSMGK